MNKINDMFGKIHVADEQKEKLYDEVFNTQNEEKKIHVARPFKHITALTAAIAALALTVVTVSAISIINFADASRKAGDNVTAEKFESGQYYDFTNMLDMKYTEKGITFEPLSFVGDIATGFVYMKVTLDEVDNTFDSARLSYQIVNSEVPEEKRSAYRVFGTDSIPVDESEKNTFYFKCGIPEHFVTSVVNGDNLIMMVNAIETHVDGTKDKIHFNDFNIIMEPEAYADYQDYDNYAAANDSFKIDIAAGKIADDIFLMDKNTPVETFTSKGLFCDLHELMNKDADFNINDYQPNIVKLLETDGKLYTTALSYQIDTIIGKTSEVGDGYCWTWDDFYKLLEQKPKETIPFAYEYLPISRQNFFMLTLNTKINGFIDYENNTCNFNTPDFIHLLELANEYPSDNEVKFKPSDFKAGSPLLMQTSIGTMDSFNSTRYEIVYFGEEITYIGYPTDDENTCGSQCDFSFRFGIANSSNDKESAFELVKFLLDDMQDTKLYSGFPHKTSALEKMADNSKQS